MTDYVVVRTYEWLVTANSEEEAVKDPSIGDMNIASLVDESVERVAYSGGR